MHKTEPPQSSLTYFSPTTKASPDSCPASESVGLSGAGKLARGQHTGGVTVGPTPNSDTLHQYRTGLGLVSLPPLTLLQHIEAWQLRWGRSIGAECISSLDRALAD
ncbi:coiled-coil domain-containing protein 94 [Platysternon megacephalum]|uniref:Coiled-coil domain-containing protein 94 n=1 Tax=Platysternon megacephalum TaxID=55544 RepID=A0A4D9E0V4_9SAUR|nr:coiled-coil domain-containing protein 94 [Platysternon megacephalum]